MYLDALFRKVFWSETLVPALLRMLTAEYPVGYNCHQCRHQQKSYSEGVSEFYTVQSSSYD